MNKKITIISNPVKLKIINADRKAKVLILDLLSYRVETMKSQVTDSMFNWKEETAPAGFFRAIYIALRKAGYEVAVHRDDAPKPLGPAIHDCIVDNFPNDPRREYQYDPAKELIKNRQIICYAATGSGKSRIAKIAYKHIGRKTMFLTTQSILMYQMKDSVEETMDEEVGVMGDSEWSPVDGFNVAMVQTLAMYLEEKNVESELDRYVNNRWLKEDKERKSYMKDLIKQKKYTAQERHDLMKSFTAEQISKHLPDEEVIRKTEESVKRHNEKRLEVIKELESFEFIIMEEAHEVSSDSYMNVMNACKNAWYRMALTGTPFMAKNDLYNMRLMATSGHIAVRVSEKQLIDCGILSTPYFHFADSKCPDGVTPTASYQVAVDKCIVNNEHRNNKILEFVKLGKEYNLPILILIKKIKHGKILYDMISKEFDCEFISGKDDRATRNAVIKSISEGKIAIGSNIMNVGVDVPSIGLLINAGGGESETQTRQKYGRALREKKSGPNVCFIVDFQDRCNAHLRKHSLARQNVVKSTSGFSENLVKELDFEMFA